MTKKWSWLLVLSLVIALIAIPVAGCSPGAPKSHDFIISEPYPEGFPQYDATVKFMEMVTEGSNGRMQFEIFPGNLLGNYIDQQIAMMRQQQDFALSWPTSAVAPRSDALWLGYMYSDWDDFQAAFAKGGWMNELGTEIYAADANIKLLASMPTGLTGITSREKFDIRDMNKGIKIRHAPSAVLEARFTAQGFDPIIMSMSEVESALLMGTIDAVGFISTPQFWQYREAYSYLYFWNDGSNPLQMMVSLTTWNSLAERDQDVILEVAEEWGVWAWEQAKMARDKTYADLEAFVEFINLTPEEWDYLASLALPVEIPIIEKTAGKMAVDVIAEHAPMIKKYRP